MQLDALSAAGVAEDRVFTDHASGAKADRDGLNALMNLVEAKDVIIVWRLDRLGRSLTHLASMLDQLRERGVGLRSLNEAIDTTTASGRMVFAIMASLAAYERELIVERVRAGMKAAARRGAHLGRPRVMTLPQREHAQVLRAQGQSFAEIAALFRVHPSTIHRVVNEVR